MTTEIEILEERLEQHRAETAAHREAELYERREMKTFFSSLNENMIHLTSAVTEWKTRDAMFDKQQQEQKEEIKLLTGKHHKLELRVNTLEGATGSNTKAKDRMTDFWLKLTSTLVILGIVGGLAFKLAGGG